MNPYNTYRYKKNKLFVEGVSLDEIAVKTGTPVYVYSGEKIMSQYRRFDRSFCKCPHLICYAVKASSNLSILRLLAKNGAGADIVSIGELFRARRAGVLPERIVFSGVGKTEDEIGVAIKANVLMMNVESREELEAIHKVAQLLRRPAAVSIRVNPDVSADTHHHITTGKAENKFGIPYGEAEDLYRYALKMPWIRIVGIQAHIGSQILNVRPYQKTLEKLLKLVDRLEKAGIFLQFLDMGGGLGVSYDGEKSLDPADLSKALLPLMKGRRLCLIFEPGRFLTAEAGCMITKVLYRKEYKHKNFVIVDAAMNDLARPGLYDAYHPIWPVRRNSSSRYKADVVGPVCETGDYLAKARGMARPQPGDYLSVMAAGAYGFSMSSQYNSRTRVPEVLVMGKKWWVVRERESVNDLIRGEKIPEFLK